MKTTVTDTPIRDVITKDTIIRTNLLTIISLVVVIVGAFVSYTVAIGRVTTNERSINQIDKRVTELEDKSEESTNLLLEIRGDIKVLNSKIESVLPE